MTVIACVKTGTQYGPEYVNRLASMVERHTTRPHLFVCLTDNPAGITCPTAPIGTDAPTWWGNLILFKPHPVVAGHRVLYVDLDTVIVGNIDPLLDYAGPFAILRDFYRPWGYCGALKGMAPGVAPFAWEAFSKTPQTMMQQFYSDQEYLERMMPNADRWQDVCPGVNGSYKADHLANGPRDFAVIHFHGRPKPADCDGWVKEAWRA